MITIEDLSNYVGRDLSSDEGAVAAVSMACETVRTLTEQDFTPTIGETITLDGSGTDTLLLPQVPVTAAGTVTENGGTLDATLDYTFTADGRLLRTDGTATLTSWPDGYGPSAYWSQGRQNITVTYDYGYADSAPDDVRMVALALAHRLVTQGGAISETVGQVSKRYAAASTDLTNGEKAILRKYRQAR